jgi:hypothetical protein
MSKLEDFVYYVAITQQATISVVAFCPKCGMSISFMDNDRGAMNVAGGLQHHMCHQTIVSVPK